MLLSHLKVFTSLKYEAFTTVRIGLVFSFLVNAPGDLRAQRKIIIHAEHPQQSFEGWGTSLAWFANRAGGWSDENRIRLARALFDPKQGLGLTYARFNIGGGDDPANPKPILLPQNKMPGYEQNQGTYDWTADANQRWFLLKAVSLGVQLTEAVSYSPPYWMTISGTSQGGSDGLSNLQQRFFGHGEGSFADYLTTVTQHYRDAWDVRFRTLVPMNESAQTWWKAGDQKQEGCHFSTEEQERLIQDTAKLLSSKGVLTTVAATDENDLDVESKELTGYDQDTLRNLQQITTHTYAGTRRAELRAVAQKLNKRLSMSEWGSDPDPEGKNLAIQITRDVSELGAVNWSIWQPDWPALLRIDYDHEKFQYTPAYGVYENFTRFIRPGAQVLPTDDPMTLAAFDARNKRLVLVTQNWAEKEETLIFSLGDLSFTNGTARAYRFSSDEMRVMKTTEIRDRVFRAAVPPHSVTTFVVSGLELQRPESRTKNNPSTLRSTGEWRPSDAFPDKGTRLSDRANDSYSIAFNGTHARIVGVLAPMEGIAGFSVDGGAETDLSLYAPRVESHSILFSTPQLAPGAHTLSVRVTGLKEFSATGNAVIAGKLEVLDTRNQ